MGRPLGKQQKQAELLLLVADADMVIVFAAFCPLRRAFNSQGGYDLMAIRLAHTSEREITDIPA